ncbi:hypothetical protein PaecuDRAFT_3746 [Paenibacillus curdlanolyticus YK9]|uniref:Carrier domain-containing protein n=1 Tax=Paenibacillus curdlanolyticus YK9 TaxID=717606 RepID=E0ICY2_9BACL|nr:acyl carrier protein [Paenibacillus curdlanolyticus]EFM09697.1 hypothetical protein PaecuDRAFT_3746 [Paenibacillus curdlanolyticus YK9]
MTNSTDQALFQTVREAVVTVMKRNVELNENTKLSDEGLDSITTVRLLVQLEKKLSIQFREEDLTLDNFVTISSIMAMLGKYGVTA